MTPRRIHLVRHGEVHNPDHVVYADLDGFHLSTRGTQQADAAGRHLAERPLAAIYASPLHRARQTAEAIARPHGLDVTIDDALTEWLIGRRWAGVVWERLDDVFPGELQAYLEHPTDLDFCPEPISTAAVRFAAVVGAATALHPVGEVAFVSHQDPVQAARLSLTSRPLTTLQQDKPGHAEIIELESAEDGHWQEVSRWRPPQGDHFPPVR